MKNLWWYMYSEESNRAWYARMRQEFWAYEYPTRWPFGSFFKNHVWLLILLWFVGLTMIAETGTNLLEPAVVSWFWAPWLAALTRPDYSRYPAGRFSLWVWKNPKKAYWIAWMAGAVLIPILIWPLLKQLDEHIAHPLRNTIGQFIGLGGQTGLLIALCCLLGLITLAAEVFKWRSIA